MNLNNSSTAKTIEPFAFEMICFIVKYLGTKNEHFEALFKMKPWLLGNKQPSFANVLYMETSKIPYSASEFYNKVAY